MEQKYQVPALRKADFILRAISAEPYRLRLIDLSKSSGIHKSSMYSLLLTMESLGWVVKDKADTYAIGSFFGAMGSSYLEHFNLIDVFHREALISRERINESLQLAVLEKDEVLYLAKEEAPAPIRVVSEPGMRYPAYATALGKVQLAYLSPEDRNALYPSPSLESLTPYTLRRREDLFRELEQIKRDGFAMDRQEALIGCQCIAAPITDAKGQVIAGISCSTTMHRWETKEQEIKAEVIALSRRISIG